MVIDQRNAGASGTAIGYTLDRWAYYSNQASKFTWQQNAGSVTPPSGYTNYLGFTSSSSYSSLSGDRFLTYQGIEGYNVSDLAWGTAAAKSVTISFWVRSSLTGTFGGALQNNSSLGAVSYPFSYSVPSANTWTQISITVPGNTSASWSTNNAVGIWCVFGLGSGSSAQGTVNTWQSGTFDQPTGTVSVVGTNGATFYITGVQLEVGSVATPFEREIYSNTLAKCQRYYYRFGPSVSNVPFSGGFCASTTRVYGQIVFPVPMRTAPSALEQSGTAADYKIANLLTATTCSAVPTFDAASTTLANINFTVASGLTAGQGCFPFAGTTSAYLGWSAEL
jgi:hypothetical protein